MDDGIDIRCPKHPVRLLLRIGSTEYMQGKNVIQIACRDCRKDLRDKGVEVKYVLHHFDVRGELVMTETVT